MNCINDVDSKNNAFYFEFCVFQILKSMGYINEEAFESLAEIAEEDYKSTLILK